MATNLTVAPAGGELGASVELRATLKIRHDGAPVPSQLVRFRLDGVQLGAGQTDAAGVARVPYKIPQQVGSKMIEAEFGGTPTCTAAKGTAQLTAVNTLMEAPAKGTNLPKAGPPGTLQGKICFSPVRVDAFIVCPKIQITASLVQQAGGANQPNSWSTSPKGYYQPLSPGGQSSAWCDFALALPSGVSIRVLATSTEPGLAPVPNPQILTLPPGGTSNLVMTIYKK